MVCAILPIEHELRITNTNIMHLPKKFKLIKCDFSLELEKKSVISSFLGSTIRGGFGSVFRRIVCITHESDCVDCILRNKCVYSYIFESPGENARYTNIPHPFVIEPPFFINKPVNRFNFSLILIGNAIDYLPYFLYTFEELGIRGLGKERQKYRIEKVTADDILIYDGEKKVLINPPVPIIRDNIDKEISSYKNSISQLTIKFITPVRIKEKGRYTDKLDFEIIVKNLIRRISLLSKYHCEEDWHEKVEIPLDIKTESSNLFWHELERYSSRQRTRLKLGGVMGEITFSGDLFPYLPLLKLGEYTHIGKATAFELGKYEINF